MWFVCGRHETASITTLWNVLRIINILIMVRLLKIIPHFRVRPHACDKCVASTSRFWHCRSALSLAFWLLWSDYCHPCLTLFKSIFCYYSGTSRIRLHFSALSLVFWLLWSDYGLHLWALIYIYFLITVEPAISGTHAWDWHKIMVKEKGSMMDASVKYLIKSVQLVLFLNVICVWPEENDFVVFDQKRMIFALFDQKRTILLCLTRREWFCLLHLTRREQFCFDSQCE